MKDLLLRPEGLRRGARAELLVRPWVLVRDGRVAHCAEAAPEGMPEGIPLLSGGWLAEPLADAHVHLFLPGSFDAGERRRVAALPREDALARVMDLLEACRLRGVAAVRDGGDPHGLALEAAALANARPERYAAVLPAGEPISRRGGYGAFLGPGAADLGEALRLLEGLRKRGATHAKLLATGINSLAEAGRVDPPGFSPAEVRALLERARVLALPAMVHANGPLEALGGPPGPGATLEHGFWLGGGDPEALAETATPWVPTLGAWAELLRHPGLTDAQRTVVAATDARHRREVAVGRAAGAALLAGSDAGTPGVEHGEGLPRELGHLARAGLPAQDCLATAFGARTLCGRWLGRPLGGLSEGDEAGFLWLAADPGEDLRALERPRAVWLGGTWTPIREASA